MYTVNTNSLQVCEIQILVSAETPYGMFTHFGPWPKLKTYELHCSPTLYGREWTIGRSAFCGEIAMHLHQDEDCIVRHLRYK